jgi:hypothetical protein
MCSLAYRKWDEKSEETAKGVRISVNVYSNNQDFIEETLNTYLKAKMLAMHNEISLAL